MILDSDHQWLDGSMLNFTYWASGEPNNDTAQLCVEMYFDNGKWNDIPCTDLKGYVCKMPQCKYTQLSR